MNIVMCLVKMFGSFVELFCGSDLFETIKIWFLLEREIEVIMSQIDSKAGRDLTYLNVSHEGNWVEPF